MSALTKAEKNNVLRMAVQALAMEAASGRLAPGYRESTLDFASAVKHQVGLWGADPDDVLNSYIDEPHDIRALVVAFSHRQPPTKASLNAKKWLDALAENRRRKRRRTSRKRR